MSCNKNIGVLHGVIDAEDCSVISEEEKINFFLDVQHKIRHYINAVLSDIIEDELTLENYLRFLDEVKKSGLNDELVDFYLVEKSDLGVIVAGHCIGNMVENFLTLDTRYKAAKILDRFFKKKMHRVEEISQLKEIH